MNSFSAILTPSKTSPACTEIPTEHVGLSPADPPASAPAADEPVEAWQVRRTPGLVEKSIGS